MTPLPDLLSVKEAADLIHLSPRSVGRLMDRKAFPWYQIGGRRMIDRADLARWLEQRKRAA